MHLKQTQCPKTAHSLPHYLEARSPKQPPTRCPTSASDSEKQHTCQSMSPSPHSWQPRTPFGSHQDLATYSVVSHPVASLPNSQSEQPQPRAQTCRRIALQVPLLQLSWRRRSRLGVVALPGELGCRQGRSLLRDCCWRR